MSILALLSLIVPSHAATLDVPSTSYPTVQDAVDAAGNGDIIEIAAGTYSGDVFISVDNLTIRGAGMNQTVLDGGVGNFGFSLDFYISATVEDLTLHGNDARNVMNLNDFAYAELNRVKLMEGRHDNYNGAGLYLDNADATVFQSIICSNNGSAGYGNYNGGGVYVNGGSSFVARESVFFGNSVDGDGGGVWASGSATLVNNVFYDNTATNGAAVYASLSTIELTNNIIEANDADSGGGTQ